MSHLDPFKELKLQVQFQVRKSTISYWLISLFTVILVISAIFSEFFQAPRLTSRELEKYRFLFNTVELDTIKTLKITNRIGTFHLSKDHRQQWLLDFPRNLHANSKTVENIMTSLKKIKIRKIYNLDPINKANFSLDTPLITITLGYAKGVEKILRMGLINPIDNSTYLTLSGKDAIYHVDSIQGSIEANDLSDFIDSKIIHYPSSQLQSLKIFRGKRLVNPQLSFTKKDTLWYDDLGKNLDEGNINTFLSHLYELNSQMILDRRTASLEKSLQKYLQSPLYTMIINFGEKNIITYTISSLVSSLEGLKIDKRQAFIVKISNRKHPYLLAKENLKLFSKNRRSLKKLPFKKLFY